jgi:hypothetical protein
MATPHFTPRPGVKSLDRGIRKVAPTYGRAAFHTFAPKAHGPMVVESASERLVSQMLGLDPSVRSFAPQPFTVDLVQGDVLHTPEQKARARRRDKVRGERSNFYTPDFQVRWSLGATTALEIKTQGWEGDAAAEHKLDLARIALADHHIDFVRLVVPSSWRHPLLTNIPLLHQAARRLDLRPASHVMEQAEHLEDSGACTLGDFCAGLGADTRMAPVLIVFGVLKVDVFAHELRNDTPATSAFGDLDHLSIVEALAL